MKKLTAFTLLAMAIGSTALTGCGAIESLTGGRFGSSSEPESDPVFSTTSAVLHGDGSVAETVIDVLDESYYKTDELEQMVRNSVSEYDAENGQDSISVTDLTFNGSQVNLSLLYKNSADFEAFNNIPFFSGSMLEAQMEGYRFDGTYSRVENGTVVKAGVPGSEASAAKELNVLISDGSHIVAVPGEIVYVSSNGIPLSANAAQKTPDAGTAGETEAEDTASGTAAEDDSLFIVMYE